MGIPGGGGGIPTATCADWKLTGTAAAVGAANPDGGGGGGAPTEGGGGAPATTGGGGGGPGTVEGRGGPIPGGGGGGPSFNSVQVLGAKDDDATAGLSCPSVEYRYCTTVLVVSVAGGTTGTGCVEDTKARFSAISLFVIEDVGAGVDLKQIHV